MTVPFPPVNPFINIPYFYANNTFNLGSISQPVNAVTEVTIDYSQLNPVPVFLTSPVFSYYIDQGGGPPLIIRGSVWTGSPTYTLTLLVAGGIPGVSYTVTTNIIHDTDETRSDFFTVEVTPAGNECGNGGVVALPIGGFSSPIGNNPIMIGSNLAFINTFPRWFVGSATPQGPNIMDYWYNPVGPTTSIFGTDGTNTFWKVIA